MPLPLLEEHATVQFSMSTYLNRSDAAVTPFVFQPDKSNPQALVNWKRINFMGFE